MKKKLEIINTILNENGYTSINEDTAREWLIEGGESEREIQNMTACYMGEIEQAQIEKNYLLNSRYF